MGRRLVEAAKACRMRRTRGEMVRVFRALAGRRLAALAAGFLAVVALVVGALVVVPVLLAGGAA
jgi:hypothetical protein